MTQEKQKIFLTLRLDDALETAVRALWIRLAAAGLNAPGTDSLRPHITLAGYDQVIPAAFIPHMQSFTQRRAAPKITLHHLGIFPAKRVLFLAARVSRPLMRLHGELLHKLQAAGFPPLNNPQFSPDNWVPHCSLLIETSPQGLQQGVRLSALDWQPLAGRALGIGLVIFPEKEDHLFFPFKSGQSS